MRLDGKAIWGALLVAGLVYEAYTLINRRKGDTLSEIVWEATDATPMTPLVIGIICGPLVLAAQ